MRDSRDKPLHVTLSSPLHVALSTSIFNEVFDFQKGIKCKLTLYPIFNENRQHDSWYHETHTIASVHGIKTVFDPHYSPPETSQALLCIKIKSFMFSVLCKNLQISAGHMLAECYSASSNAQIVSKELCDHYKILSMPKHMCKTSMQTSPIYICHMERNIPGLPQPLGIPMATHR